MGINGTGPQPPKPVQAPPRGIFTEAYVPDEITVIANEARPGQTANLVLLQFAGSVAPGVFLGARAATLAPDVAIRLGEHLAREGRRVQSGIVLAPANPSL